MTNGDPADAAGPAHRIGAGATVKDTENLRAKLKRLVARQIRTEPEAELFTLAPPMTSA
ncbi:hypothetical protein [Micromonospora inaquosa]|uniref:hypothetical protein n=1 Tax=Micromonospora inaquosa TaxID=2203716 RepID=UPI0013155CBD|nr:hypothetical protein [Micromonospora inaquosa]